MNSWKRVKEPRRKKGRAPIKKKRVRRADWDALRREKQR